MIMLEYIGYVTAMKRPFIQYYLIMFSSKDVSLICINAVSTNT